MTTLRQCYAHAAAFISAEDGPTATEYAVLLGLIIVVVIVAVTQLGNQADSAFTGVSDALPS